MKKIISFTFLLIFSFAAIKAFALPRNDDNPKKINAKSVKKIMEKVADWQLNHWKQNGSKHRWYDWTNAAGYTGLAALGYISKKPQYIQTLLDKGDSLKWETGPRRFFADDYCIGQAYSLLYAKYKDEKMILNFRRLADSIVAAPHTESLEWKNRIQLREWAWCDALFMGPTALSYLSKVTGQQKYLDIALKLWWKTTDYLYDPAEHLYARDGSYLNKKEKNGAKVFWSRGNGWVLAGLVRVLENMPENYPDRERFISLYKEMASKIASIQQPDGSWHASLLDPASYPIKEMSGTGFYCYALLWGLNNDLLDKKTYWPVVQKSWQVLVSSVHEDGMLGYVQPIGAAPDKVDANSTEIYGVGAFLLAGSELYKYIKN
ncbi:MAG: glycoside hydrolase family 88 protein [Ferruginibacter sp.]|nr:glycoside hydrolase family 88 protein [Ferruginibacter sp.]